jgi:mRNA interferase RelE/StbE
LALDQHHRARITGAIELLARNPHPPAARKLANRLAYRVRVGDYRIIYSVNDTTITIMVLAIGHRRDVYR